MVSSAAIASSYHTAAAYGGAITPPHAVLNDNDPNNTTVCCNAFCKKFWHHQNCDHVEMGHVLWTVFVFEGWSRSFCKVILLVNGYEESSDGFY
jgi:hypothetical protein